jgi:hypothetical protein
MPINIENIQFMITILRNFFLSLLMCAATVAFADTAASTMGEVVDAVFTLEQELLTAKTPAAIEAAKAKALAAGVPLKTVEVAVASRTAPRTAVASSTTSQSQPAVKKSVTIGGSTTASANSIPAGSTNIGDTGSTYN